eukprot:GFUD01109494.1.p1 GENE.GFUD01109494.1~~GFUD01109494.1.p1  ORF type:complete len:409 (+),score=94.03 GFUD01109494.1:76-1302(+)
MGRPRKSTTPTAAAPKKKGMLAEPPPTCSPSPSDSSSGWNCTDLGLRVRQDSYQEEGSTVALRGSFISEQEESGTGEEVDIYEETKNNSDDKDILVQSNEHDGEVNAVNGSYADILAEGEGTNEVSPEDNQAVDIIKKSSTETSKLRSPVHTPNSAISQENVGPNNSLPKLPGQEEFQVCAPASFSSTYVPSHTPGHSLATEIDLSSSSRNITPEQACQFPQEVVQGKQTRIRSLYTHNLYSHKKFDQVVSHTSPSAPVMTIPTSEQKSLIPSSPLYPSTPTASLPSLSTPQISTISALPLVERDVSVSHLSLHTSGTHHLPASPTSCHCNEYSPVYNMQFGSARRLASEDTSYFAATRVDEDLGGSKMGRRTERRGVVTEGENCEGVKNPLEIKVIIWEDSTDLSPE